MAIEKVQLTVSSIQSDLSNGHTWLKKDDLGYGSIQEKYGATDNQIMTIRKHPALKDLETIAKIFIIVDDTKKEEALAPAKLEVCDEVLSNKVFLKDTPPVLDVHTYETPLAVHQTLDIDDGGAKAAFDNL